MSTQNQKCAEGGRELIRELFDDFLDSLGGRQTAVNRRDYQHRLKLFLEMFGELAPAELTVQNVNRWHQRMMALGHADATNAGYRQALKGFLNWLVREEYLDSSPADHLKIGSYVPEEVVLPDEENVQAVTTLAIKWLEDESADYLQILRASLWLYQYEAGGRLGGLVFLRLKEVERVLDSGPNEHGAYRLKSREKTGDVLHEITEITVVGLRRLLELRPSTTDMRFWVGSRRSRTAADPVSRYRALSRSSLQKHFPAICKAAGVTAIYPHSLRHRIGDLYTRTYGPKIAARKLNHSDIATTLNWYHRASQNDVSAATAALRPQIKRPDADALVTDFFRKIGD